MRKSCFTGSQIVAILKQAENDVLVPELCREHGMRSATFYKWRAKFGGMEPSMMACLKELGNENRRFKKMYTEERLKRRDRPGGHDKIVVKPSQCKEMAKSR